MPYHQNAVILSRQLDQILRGRGRERQRLLHEHIFIGLQGLPGKGSVGGYRRRHHHGVQVTIGEELLEISSKSSLRVLAGQSRPFVLVQVARVLQPYALNTAQAPHQVRSPISKTYDSDV